MRQFNTLVGFLASKSSNPTTDSTVEFKGYSVIGDGGAATWQHNGVTGQTPSQSPIQLGDSLLNDADGNQWSMTLSNDFEFELFADIGTSTIGNVGQRLICRERANAEYILQPTTYLPLAGDATLASGLFAELQVTTDGWHIEHFGAIESTLSTAAIKDAIDRADKSTITGRAVSYWFNEEFIFSKDSSGIVCPSGVMTLFNTSLTERSVTFSPSNPELGEGISKCQFKGVRLGRSVGSSGAVALSLHSVDQFEIDSFYSLASHTALEIKGISLSNFSNLFLFAGNNIDYLPDSSLITYAGFPLMAGGFTPAFTTNVNNMIASGDFKCDHIFNIEAADGFEITCGYLASPFTSHFNLEPLEVAEGIGSLLVNSVYLDGINTATGSLSAITIPSHVGSFINTIKFSDCKLGNFQSDIVLVNGKVTNFELNGTTLRSSNGKGLMVNSDAASTVKVIGGDIGFCTEAVDIRTIKSFSIVGSSINNCDTGVKLVNTEKAVVDDLTFDSVTTELDISNVPVLSGGSCVSDANGVVDVNSGTFTPTLRINFATTGLVYTVQDGTYVRNGNVVTIQARVVLSSKGTETGAITIQNLPFAIAKFTTMNTYFNSITAGSGDNFIQSRSSAEPSPTLNIRTINASGSAVEFTEADITDTTEVVISGSYITT